MKKAMLLSFGFACTALAVATALPARTQIVYDSKIPSSGRPRVEIFDASACLVEMVLDRVLDAGAHDLDLDAFGRARSSTYFFRINSNEQTRDRPDRSRPEGNVKVSIQRCSKGSRRPPG